MEFQEDNDTTAGTGNDQLHIPEKLFSSFFSTLEPLWRFERCPVIQATPSPDHQELAVSLQSFYESKTNTIPLTEAPAEHSSSHPSFVPTE